MKKFDINPLFLLFSSLLIFIISIYSLSTTKSNKQKSIDEFTKNNIIINEYKNLKNTWINKKVQRQIIDKLIKILHIENSNITQNKNKITVSIKKSNIQTINKFVNKLLNKKLNIIKLKITKNTLFFEVGLV